MGFAAMRARAMLTSINLQTTSTEEQSRVPAWQEETRPVTTSDKDSLATQWTHSDFESDVCAIDSERKTHADLGIFAGVDACKWMG
ncbi:hypothetical protein V3481_010698 [Fusarium oxysporum f. sp. vasinfectum]